VRAQSADWTCVRYNSRMAENENKPLEWETDDDVYRAYDDFGIYVIYRNDAGNFAVGFFPSPGPMGVWNESCNSFEEAKSSVELCASWVKSLASR
jgi:hypothetical protein